MATIAEHRVTPHARRLTPEMARDLILMGLAASSGAVDAICWLGLGKVFTAFQTGNVAFLGFDAGGGAGPSATRVAISLAAFAAGVLLAAPIVKPSRGSGLWPRRIAIALGVSVLVQVAFLVAWVAASGHPSTGTADLLIALSAIAMGMQSAAIRSLGVTGVFTTAATATLIYLVSDIAGLSPSVAERRRLAGVLLGLFVGAAVGALLLDHARAYAPVLPPVLTAMMIAAASIALEPAR